MTLSTVLALSLAFVVLNGVFVAAEFALIAVPKPSLERRATQGHWLAGHLLRVLNSPRRQDRYVATAQLGITLASLGLGMYGEHGLSLALEPWLGHVPWISAAALGTAIALAILTVAHIVIGEMLPKGLALQNPERVAGVTHWPMQITLIILYPFVALSNLAARTVLRIFGITRQRNAQEQVYTPEELQIIVEESERGGALRADSGRIVRELLDFGDLTASQVMVPRVRVVGIPLGATADDVRRLIVEHRRTRYAVYDGDLDHVVGMLHAKDLLRLLIDGGPVVASAVRRVPVVPETASIDDLLATLQRSPAQMALVIDEHGGTAGIVSLEDVFEEVVGEIDEGVPSSPPIVQDPDGSVRAAGTVRLDELGRYFDLDLEHEEVESVSGLVLERLGRPPTIGDAVDYDRLRFEVTVIAGRGVKEERVRMRPE